MYAHTHTCTNVKTNVSIHTFKNSNLETLETVSLLYIFKYAACTAHGWGVSTMNVFWICASATVGIQCKMIKYLQKDEN
jgi:hypothetical protein